ncbi:MAG: diaminopimelate epimerase [Gemmatimonadetes bacterium]|nr:diaminopimelate epimerase [Gemmatimonadota bacterium]
MKCEKWHALANDFLIADRRDEHEGDPARFAASLCDRHRGAGGDGLLAVEPSPDNRSDAFVSIWNADGSRAEISGNGLRCAAGFLLRSGDADRCSIRTQAGTSDHRVIERAPPGCRIESRFPAPSFDPRVIGLDGKPAEGEPFERAWSGGAVRGTAVSVGNPHFVLFEGWTDDNWRVIGAELESDPFFRNRVNVEFARVIDRATLQVFVYERGVGETASSGTGASASFAAARRAGIVDAAVDVRLAGGTLSLREEPDGFLLTGSCERIGVFETDPSWWERINDSE